MNSRSIISIFRCVYFPPVKMHLGRWNIHNDKETILKIQYATEDNCGISCYNYKNTTQVKENNKLDDNKYIYMMGYESAHE